MIVDGRKLEPYSIIRTAEEIANQTNEQKVLITDFDDTLAFSAIKHYDLILKSKHIETYKQYMNIKPMSDRFFYSRNLYYTNDWLKRADVDEIPQEIRDEITELFNLPDFYQGVKPTKFAYALREYLTKDYCKKVYILSHCLSDTSINGKLDWVADFYKGFNPEKIEFIPTKDTKKSIPIMEKNIKWDIFADDRLDCIYDMVLFAQGFGNEILIPEFGYNKADERFTNLVENYNLQTFYINVF